MLSIGFAGYGLIPHNKIDFDCPIHSGSTNSRLVGGYGGLYFEYIHSSNSIIHPTVNFFVGTGGLSIFHTNYSYKTSDPKNNGSFDPFSEEHPSSWIMVLEPGISADANITKFFRISLGVGYRIVPNLDMSYKDGEGVKRDLIATDAMNGLSLNLSFKFGRF